MTLSARINKNLYHHITFQSSDDNLYKDDNTPVEMLAFYLLLILNLILVVLAVKNIYYSVQKRNELPVRRLIRFNIFVVIVIGSRLVYESDVIPRTFGSFGWSKEIYVFFGVNSTILFGTLMILCAYYWYKIVVLICLDVQNPPIKISLAWKVLVVMLALNGGFLLLNFIEKIIMQEVNGINPLVTSFVSISSGTIFALSALLLHQYIKTYYDIDKQMKDVVKRGRWIGVCAIFRSVIEITFHFEFSREWKVSSETKGNGISWALFIFTYFVISDIIPTYLFIEQFSIRAANPSRANSAVKPDMNESLLARYSLPTASGKPYTLRKRSAEGRFFETIFKYERFLSTSGTISGGDLAHLEIVALLFAGSWCPPCRDFGPKLKEFYFEINRLKKRLEIIFVSGDYDQQAFQEYFSSMPWIAIPYEDHLREHLIEELEIGAIPEVFVLAKNGTIVTKRGKHDIEKLELKAFDKWLTMTS